MDSQPTIIETQERKKLGSKSSTNVHAHMYKHCKIILKKISEMSLPDTHYKVSLIFKRVSKVSIRNKRRF